MQSIVTVNQHLGSYNIAPKFIHSPMRENKPNISLAFVKENPSPVLLSRSQDALKDNCAEVEDCLSCISDPLWKDVCASLHHIMGSAPVLKIWKSKLGEFCAQDKVFDLTCESEEVAEFVQKYDFVILASLQRYFPALKQLRVQTAEDV